MSGVLTVAAGAVEGFGTVYNGLETSAGILGKNISENSVKIIEHKYGLQAGNIANDTFDTVGNMINISQNMSLITPKGLVKKTVKGTGKAIVGNFKPKLPRKSKIITIYFFSETESKLKNVLFEICRNKLCACWITLS